MMKHTATVNFSEQKNGKEALIVLDRHWGLTTIETGFASNTCDVNGRSTQ